MVQFPCFGDAIKHIRLFAYVQGFVEPLAQAVQRRFADHGRGHGNPLPGHEFAEHHAPRRMRRLEHPRKRALLAEHLGIRAHQAEPRIGIEQHHLLFQLGGKPFVITVQKRQQGPLSLGNGKVPRGPKRNRLLSEEIPHLLAVALRDGGAVVRGTVVPEHDFPIGPRLPENRIHRLAKVFRAVVAIHDHRNFRHRNLLLEGERKTCGEGKEALSPERASFPSPSSPKTFVSGANGVWGGPAAYPGKQFPGSAVHKNSKGVKKTTRTIAFSAL